MRPFRPSEPESSFKSRGGFQRLGGALRYSLRGLAAAWRFEAAFRQEVALLLIALPLAMWLGETTAERLLLVLSLVAVLVVELLNSAIEALCDLVHPDPHPLIARAKDLGSAAVFLTLIAAAALWLFLWLERF
ncbi:diacylglycerol kinase [Hydrogenophilus thermoluteolus]|jgi:diacylglycerol kinase (ATP)|uniref:Diacylglycerol kinase n=1 Tax=Hydrogenophilus thermoluteolus TaxID=297 RepID=A0A2Z6E0M6_HYDTE|nr:diacylglycerol kinase [Hydrogenophilus thermoluteolus]HCO77793.1 diacylglycerol kinase [Rhodocyclaceae bacterium]MBW7656182.1 diacylglycerol kinase [Hydrogenophilus thermoluteolus]BBD78139.1 diacylglycerol kinase [Hydrogenophilus thermoluteolus]GLW61438.1 diacylglycerol kinase [Hydrogenophilus thermoluteolus]HNU18736.1 diacylglycerol kinase [Hydrogenophilus thermoluteolus]